MAAITFALVKLRPVIALLASACTAQNEQTAKAPSSQVRLDDIRYGLNLELARGFPAMSAGFLAAGEQFAALGLREPAALAKALVKMPLSVSQRPGAQIALNRQLSKLLSHNVFRVEFLVFHKRMFFAFLFSDSRRISSGRQLNKSG